MLVDDFDGALFDLDGVIYLGDHAVPAAPPTLAQLRERGVKVSFVTNNAGRSPEDMAKRIAGFGIECRSEDVATSAQAIVSEMAQRIAPGSKVLIIGSAFLREEVERAGLEPVASADDDPAAAVQGFAKELDQPMLYEACLAVSRGVPWYVSNTDLVIPSDRGMCPGAGAFVHLVQDVTGAEPVLIAGKPFPPLFRAAIEKLGAQHPIFVGDRLDTDIEGAKALGLANLWVMTGAHGKADLLAAPEERRPDAIAADLGGLLRPRYELEIEGDAVRCGDSSAQLRDGTASVSVGEDAVAALWALANLAWTHEGIDTSAALEEIDLP